MNIHKSSWKFLSNFFRKNWIDRSTSAQSSTKPYQHPNKVKVPMSEILFDPHKTAPEDLKFKLVLNKVLDQFHLCIDREMKSFWDNYAKSLCATDDEVARLLNTPRMAWIDHAKGLGISYGSTGGILFEWCMHSLIKTLITHHDLDPWIEVCNNHQIPYTWNKTGKPTSKDVNDKSKSVLNIDLAVVDRKELSSQTPKVYFAVEMKTNFDSGFEKYTIEERALFHHRTKTYKRFRYYYMSCGIPPKSILTKLAQQIQTLQRHNSLYCLEDPMPTPIPRGSAFVREIWDQMLALKALAVPGKRISF